MDGGVLIIDGMVLLVYDVIFKFLVLELCKW